MEDKVLSEEQWAETKNRFRVGSPARVVVKKHVPFGMFVALPGAADVSALIEAISYRPGGTDVDDPSHWPAEGSPVEAVVSGYRDHLQQVVLRVGPPIGDNKEK